LLLHLERKKLVNVWVVVWALVLEKLVAVVTKVKSLALAVL
jgi:hypothetical protein